PGGEVVTNTFDAAGQPFSLFAGGSPVVKGARYNALRQPRSIDFGNGLSQRRYYGGLDTTLYNISYGRMRQLCVAQTNLGECADDAAPGRGGTGTTLFNAVYGYDAGGNITAIDERTPNLGEINNYLYDSLDRLTEWRKVTSWSPYSATLQEAYIYNPIGNMTNKAGVTITNGTAKSGVLTTLGFEAYSVYSPSNPGGSFVTPQTFGSWSFEGSAGVSYNNTHLTSGNPAAPEGMQVAFIQGAARMTATVSGFTIGQTYRLGFQMAQRTNYGLPQTVTVRVANVALGVFVAPTGAYGPKWSEPFTATATSQTIAFWGAPENGQDRMAFIDRVVVATAGPHAAVGMANGNSYVYDPNGNMIVRREVSGTQPYIYTQGWTVDNRLAIVVKFDVTGTILATTTIGYDGDGVRVRKTDPSGTTYYLGAVEVLITGTTQLTTSYYAFGRAMVAMRTTATATLTYLHGDHLGSTSLTTNAAGQKVSEQRYKPYGEVRWASGSMPTDFTFTSQRAGPPNYVGSLIDYVARFYSPALGRFTSADTIVPGAGNPQAFNRYMYVLGNVLRLIDPSGHGACAGMSNQEFWDCRWYTAHGFDNTNGKWEHTGKVSFEDVDILTELLGEGGITWKNDTANWKRDELDGVATGVSDLLYSLSGGANLKRLLGNRIVAFVRRAKTTIGCSSTACASFGSHEVEFSGGYKPVDITYFAFDTVHEIGHFIGEVNRTPWGFTLQRGFIGNEKYVDAFPWHKDSATTQYAQDNDRKGNAEYFADAISRFVYPTYDRPYTKPGQPLHVDQSNWLNHVFFGYAYP
ncbi:MAG: RHS repeat-associated core domain-containing protein, partial [Thermoflexales bacterium]